jgi:hypothetical protein
MSLSRIYNKDTRVSSIGKVSIDQRRNIFWAGSRSFEVTPHEAAIISRLMIISPFLPNEFTAEDMTRALSFQTEELFEQAFSELMDKLSDFDIANYGGNGSAYEETIYASELIREKGGGYSFYPPLAKLIGEKPILSDEQLDSIKYQSQSYQPLACCK